jgi:pimeloyl-ACP methyl ester carboxylesterase
MDLTAQSIQVPDGRTVMFAEWGDPHGAPVFALHGTPGCRLNRHPNEELVRSTGARLITYDRPGYGGSDRLAGRQVADCVGDLLAIADALDLERFAVWGGSGGGPHALAVAALAPHRVTRAFCSAGGAPYDALGEAWTEGMDPENVKEFGWAIEGEDWLAKELAVEDAKIREMVLHSPASLLDDFDLSESDRAVLGREDFAAVIREFMLEASRNGVWGFDATTIAVPVCIEYGTADVLVPPSHGDWLARNVPGAEVKLNELGHLGDPDTDLVERHAWLLSDE